MEYLISIETNELSQFARLRGKMSSGTLEQLTTALSVALPGFLVRAFRVRHKYERIQFESESADLSHTGLCESDIDRVIKILNERVSSLPNELTPNEQGEFSWAISRAANAITHVRVQRDATLQRLNEMANQRLAEMRAARDALRTEINAVDSKLSETTLPSNDGTAGVCSPESLRPPS